MTTNESVTGRSHWGARQSQSRPLRLPIRLSRLLAGTLITLVPAVALAAAPGARASSANLATAYQLDAAHDGNATASLTAPLAKVWSITLTGSVSYPLIVNGTVFVTARNTGTGTSLYAINQATGVTLWSHQLGGSYYYSALTYDAGQIFTINTSGQLSAFDAASGQVNWTISLPGSIFDAAPTATNGEVYVGGGGKLYAIAQTTGHVTWSASVKNGDESSPAVDANGVYVTYACGQDYAFDPFTGTLIWHDDPPCDGGGGKTPALANGSVYTRDFNGNLILSAGSGQSQASFSSTPIPAVGGGRAFLESGGTLTAVNQSGLGTVAWTFTGDAALDTAPLLVGGLVFEGSSNGEIYAVDASTGTSAWSTNVGAAISGPDEQNVSSPLTGLAAGEGTLVVPAGSTLTLYASASLNTAAPSNIQAPTILGSPASGQPIGVDVGRWSALATGYSYQWLRCDGSGAGCAPIAGATSQAYDPGGADIGSTLKVTVAATNTNGTSEPVTSSASAVVSGSPPANSSLPTITGSPIIGQTLTANPGTWTPSAPRYSYQWLACAAPAACKDIAGANAATYVPTWNELSETIEVKVTAFNGAGGSAPAVSAPSAPVTSAGGDSRTVTQLRLTSSRNPARVGDVIVFRATVTPAVDGGTLAFTENGRPLIGCASASLSNSRRTVTCTVSAARAGTFAISARYSGDSSYADSSTTLPQAIKPRILPPKQTVGQHRGTRLGQKKPNFSLVLMAVRTSGVPRRYGFDAANVSCTGGASAVRITIGTSTTTVSCKSRKAAASPPLTAHRTYAITARAVRYDKKRRILARGPVYRLSLYMPGDEALWLPSTI